MLDDNTENAALVWETISDLGIMRSIIQAAFAAMDAAAVAPVLPNPSSNAPPARIRVVDTLKPPVLSLQNTPVEFRNWKRKLDAFLVQATSIRQASWTNRPMFASFWRQVLMLGFPS